METERQILEKLIKDGKDAERKLEELKVTYSVGDRFLTFAGSKVLLAKVHSGAGLRVVMIDLTTGVQHNSPEPVCCFYKITKEELAPLCLCKPVRYWDSRKKVKT